MASVIKLAKTIRNNWKKSVFFTGLAAFGVDYGKKKWEESLLRTAYCLEAKRYGDVPCPGGHVPRKVTVFLNPAAQGGKGKKLFDTNVAPILHLAGLQVTVVKTEYEGQAKQYMGVMEDTDAVVVAGGNGTLLEVVTGLLRRDDAKKFSEIPIGVVPLGSDNVLARSLFMQGESNVRWLLEAAMAVVKNQTKSADIMCIKGNEDKTVFAVHGIDWGIFRDAEERKSKYWYYAGLKHRFTYLWSTLRFWPSLVGADMTYAHPCEGCSRCYVAPPKPQWRWWHLIRAPYVEVPKKNYSEIENAECGQEHSTNFTTVEFSCKTCNSQPSKEDDRGMNIRIGPAEVSRTDFIKEGWRRIGEKVEDADEARGVTHLSAGKFSLQPQFEEGKEYWFSIDHEQYEAMPVRVELLKDQIKVFCADTQRPFVS